VIVRGDLRASIILWFSWKHIVFFAAYSLVIFLAFHKAHWKFMAIPFLPVGTIGTAVAFYVGFKNNSSYERLWEGRKIWGAIEGLSRSWGALIMAIPEISLRNMQGLCEQLIRRQIAWCNVLRLQLRNATAHRNLHRTPPEVALAQSIYGPALASEKVEIYVQSAVAKEDLPSIESSTNPALRLLELQLIGIESLSNEAGIKEGLTDKLREIVVDCIKEQGSSERLKSFPFPRQYAYFSGVFVWIFLLLLPFGLMDELGKGSPGLDWLVIPFSTLISWMFITMEQVGDSSEDPFEMAINDVPLTAICRNIEIELLQMLGEKDLPAAIVPVADILM
jgi:ion channel-forming bestrophin family protein